MDLLAPCDEFFDWHACRIQDATPMSTSTCCATALAADYNPTELDVAPGDHLEVLGIQGAWLRARCGAWPQRMDSGREARTVTA